MPLPQGALNIILTPLHSRRRTAPLLTPRPQPHTHPRGRLKFRPVFFCELLRRRFGLRRLRKNEEIMGLKKEMHKKMSYVEHYVAGLNNYVVQKNHVIKKYLMWNISWLDYIIMPYKK